MKRTILSVGRFTVFSYLESAQCSLSGMAGTWETLPSMGTGKSFQVSLEER
jgi:hypothetical protein